MSFTNSKLGADSVVLTPLQRNRVAGTLAMIHECAGEEGRKAILAAWEAASTDQVVLDPHVIPILHEHDLVNEHGVMKPYVAAAINQSLRQHGKDEFSIARVE